MGLERSAVSSDLDKDIDAQRQRALECRSALAACMPDSAQMQALKDALDRAEAKLAQLERLKRLSGSFGS
jgi:cell division FtsZ-interacting protein ZapD